MRKTEQQMDEKVIQIIAELINHPIQSIEPTTHLYNELQVDSLQFLILLDQIELEFAISIDFSDFDQSLFETPEMIVQYVKRKV